MRHMHPHCRCKLVPADAAEPGMSLDARLQTLIEGAGKSVTGAAEALGEAAKGGLAGLTAVLRGISAPVTQLVDYGAQYFGLQDGSFIKSNYEYNKQFAFSGYLNGQNYQDAAESQLKIGYGVSRDSGCGWIATYNALLALGAQEHPADLIRHYEETGGTIALGALGINPFSVADYFEKKGYQTEYEALPKSQGLDEKIKASGAAILNYIWFRDDGLPGALHFVTVQWDEGRKKFVIYNSGAYGERDDDTRYGVKLPKPSVEEWLEEENYIPFSLILLE